MSVKVIDATKRVADTFFSKDNVERTLLILMDRTINLESDPVSSTCIRCMETPFEISLTEKGLAPFRNDPTIVIPFNKMTKPQLTTLQCEIRLLEQNNLLLFCAQNTSGIFVHTSCITKYYIEPSLVLFALIKIMHNSTKHSSISSNELISVMIQKLANCAKLPSQAIAQAKRLHMQEMNAEIASQQAQPLLPDLIGN